MRRIRQHRRTDAHWHRPDRAFSFIPQRPDTYRVGADLLPARTHVQQYSEADIPSTTPRQGKMAENELENRHAEIDGCKFDLSLEKEVIHERETIAAKLRVTQPDGQPCKKLNDRPETHQMG